MKKYMMLALLLALGNQIECKPLKPFNRTFKIDGKGLTVSKGVTSVTFKKSADKDLLIITTNKGKKGIIRTHITGKKVGQGTATLNYKNKDTQDMNFTVINKSGSQVELKTKTTNSESSSYSGPGSIDNPIPIPVGEVAYVGPTSWTVKVKSGPGKIVTQKINSGPAKFLKASKTGIIKVTTTYTNSYQASESANDSLANADGSAENPIPIVVKKPRPIGQISSFLPLTAKVISGPGTISTVNTTWGGPTLEITASKSGIIKVATTTTTYYEATSSKNN